MIYVVHFDGTIFVAGDEGVFAPVETYGCDLVIGGELVLVDLHEVLSEVQLGHGAFSYVEGVQDLLALVVEDHVA